MQVLSQQVLALAVCQAPEIQREHKGYPYSPGKHSKYLRQQTEMHTGKGAALLSYLEGRWREERSGKASEEVTWERRCRGELRDRRVCCRPKDHHVQSWRRWNSLEGKQGLWLVCSSPGGGTGNAIREVRKGLVTRLGFILSGSQRSLSRDI